MAPKISKMHISLFVWKNLNFSNPKQFSPFSRNQEKYKKSRKISKFFLFFCQFLNFLRENYLRPRCFLAVAVWNKLRGKSICHKISEFTRFNLFLWIWSSFSILQIVHWSPTVVEVLKMLLFLTTVCRIFLGEVVEDYKTNYQKMMFWNWDAVSHFLAVFLYLDQSS